MKILHIIKTCEGASWAVRQIRELILLGHEVHVLMPKGKMNKNYKSIGAHVYLFPRLLTIKKPIFFVSNLIYLKKMVKSVCPDIIHSHFYLTTIMMRIALVNNNTPRIFHVPGPLHLEHILFKKIDLILASKHDYWLASCKWVQNEYLISGIDSQRVGLAYYGVDSSFFQEESIQYDLRGDLGLASDTPIIGMVAYFYAPKKYLNQKTGLKGHEDLIDALPLVLKSFPDVKCIFVGSAWDGCDWYFDQVVEYAEKIAPNTCYFLGYRDDVKNIYKSIDISVHPSHSENVGGALESLARSVPTIATNIGGFPDLIEDGKTGFLVPVSSPQLLAKKISWMLGNKNNAVKMGERGKIKAQHLMDIKVCALEIDEFYSHIVKGVIQ